MASRTRADPLAAYNAKRDIARTAQPAGKSNVIDLMAALKASVEGKKAAQEDKPEAKKAPAKRAPARKPAASKAPAKKRA
jgi:DNA end-binding protein Ku